MNLPTPPSTMGLATTWSPYVEPVNQEIYPERHYCSEATISPFGIEGE